MSNSNAPNPYGELGDQLGYQSEDDPFNITDNVTRIKYPPDLIRDFHQRSDVDSATFSQHHTLGIGKNQGSPGNHTHDGTSSVLLGKWQDQSNFAFLALTTNPTNIGQSNSRWTQIGKLVHWKGDITFQASSTFGSGAFVVPVPSGLSLRSRPGSGGGYYGSCWGVNGGSAQAIGVCCTGVWTGYDSLVFGADSANAWSATVPFTWTAASNTYLAWDISFEVN